MTPEVEAAFQGYSNSDVVSYVSYWDGLAVRNDVDLFRRFLFAFMSVHTTWESNVAGYKAIRDHERWLGTRNGLRTALVQSGAGFHNNRAKWITRFADDYWAGPQAWRRAPREAWQVYRDRLERSILGLGPAKVSFALELAFPLEAEVVCLDVHMLRLYGAKPEKVRVGEYERMEHDWLGRARAVELPSFIVKQMHWDRMQGQPDSRYWSHTLEES